MSRIAHPPPGAKEAETIVETRRDLLHGECLRARGGELDRERDAVQLSADLTDRREVGALDGKIATNRATAVEEDTNGREPLDLFRGCILGRRRQRLHHIRDLSCDAEQNATRRQHSDIAAGAEELVNELTARRRQMLAIVEHEQELA